MRAVAKSGKSEAPQLGRDFIFVAGPFLRSRGPMWPAAARAGKLAPLLLRRPVTVGARFEYWLAFFQARSPWAAAVSGPLGGYA